MLQRGEPEDGDQPVIQETKKFKKTKKELRDKMAFQRITDVTCLEDIASCGGRSPHCPNGFSTVMISLCRTSKFQNENDTENETRNEKPSQILNNAEVLKFLDSKVRDRLVIFGQGDKLNKLWKDLYKKASDLIEI